MDITPFDIDLERLKQKKIKQFVHEHKLYKLSDFAQLKSFSKKHPEIAQFHQHIKTFLVEENIDKVWDVYKTIAPKDAWSGSILSFGFQYSKPQNKLGYIDDDYEQINEGDIVFINVGFFNGLVNIAVGHEVTAVNDKEKYIETCYLLFGKAAGTQQMRLKPTPDGFTEITHHTIYRSDSVFRDKVLYPFLHTQAISEFHANIKRKIMEGK